MMTLNIGRFGVVWIIELREHVNTWLISTKNAARSSNSSRATIVLLRYLRRTDPAVLRRCVSLRESSDVVDIRTSFRLSTASLSRDMGLKISTASTNVQPRRMAKSWETGDARSRSDTLLKRHTLARARGGGYTAVVQAIVTQLAVYATKTASN